MAQVTISLGTAVVTPAAGVAPGVSETVTTPGPGVYAFVAVGATATTITVVRPGDHPSGDPVADRVIGPLTSVPATWIPLTTEFRDSLGNATVNFSQVAGVTWQIVRV